MTEISVEQVLEQLSRDGQLEWQLAVQRATIAALEAELAELAAKDDG